MALLPPHPSRRSHRDRFVLATWILGPLAAATAAGTGFGLHARAKDNGWSTGQQLDAQLQWEQDRMRNLALIGAGIGVGVAWVATVTILDCKKWKSRCGKSRNEDTLTLGWAALKVRF